MPPPFLDQRAEVDMRRNILLTGSDEWTVVKRMVIVAEQSAFSTIWCIQSSGFVAIIDSQYKASPRQSCRSPHPAQRVQIDLRSPAIAIGSPGNAIAIHIFFKCRVKRLVKYFYAPFTLHINKDFV